MASQRRAAILENYLTTGQNPPAAERRYSKLSPEGVYALLDSAGKMHVNGATRNTVSARALLELMSEGHWQCRATAHEGGHPNDQAADPYLHFNIWFERAQGRPQHYHVRCHERQRGGSYVFQVTF